VETTGLTLSDVDALKERVFSVIDTELKQHLANLPVATNVINNEYRSRPAG
jgi:1-acyl-sn-glycerol-3-phosphate acyltransferase